MAVLTNAEMEDSQRRASQRAATTTWTKPAIRAALQAIEGRMQLAGTKAALSGDIESAAPGVFNAGQKDELFSLWCRLNVVRGGLL